VLCQEARKETAMRAIVCPRLGGPEVLELRDLPVPEPGPGEVRLAVHAAGVNFADTLMIQGRYQERVPPPFVPGLEIAGTVEALGPGLADLTVGQRALALLDKGAFAERAVAAAGDVVPIPDNLDLATAAGFAITYGTAYGALAWRAGLGTGETLLVHGAAGGVGLATVECGRALGATVIATARGAGRAAVAAAHGADHALDSEDPALADTLKELTAGRGVDVVVDPVGGAVFDASLKALAWEGRIVSVGFASGTVPQIPANRLLVKNVGVLGFYWGSYRRRDPARLRAAFAALFGWCEIGAIRPEIATRMPLARAGDALRLLLERGTTGKIVLDV
jgi:NADPH2:quinone reductase